MTSKPKVYSNYRFDELVAFSQQNPHRSRRLSPMEFGRGNTLQKQRERGERGARWGKEERGGKEGKEVEEGGYEEEEKNVSGWVGYTVQTVEPSGLLSMVVCMEDPHAYALSTPFIRAQQVMEVCTRLQERTEELKNGPLLRKRKRVYELLGALYHGTAVLEEKDYADLFLALEVFQDAHFIRLHRTVQDVVEGTGGSVKKPAGVTAQEAYTLSFSSSPLLWKKERPVWLVDSHGRWIAIPTDTNQPMMEGMGKWLRSVEEKGWKIEWPESEGSKTEIVEQLTTLGVWTEGDKKRTKDVLAIRLGREKTLRRFAPA